MSKLHWMPLLVNDIRSSNRWRALTKSQRGCYIDLLCIAWCNADCMLPASLEQIHRLADCFSVQDKLDTDHVLELCFEQHDESGGRYYNAKQLEIWEEQRVKHAKRVSAAKQRWKKANSNAGSAAHALHEHGASVSDSDSDSKGNKKIECPLWDDCTHFRMDEDGYRLAQEWYQKNKLPLSLIRPVALAVDAWLAADTPNAKRARRGTDSHHMRLYKSCFIEDGRRLAGQLNGGQKQSAHERNMEKLQRAEAEAGL